MIESPKLSLTSRRVLRMKKPRIFWGRSWLLTRAKDTHSNRCWITNLWTLKMAFPSSYRPHRSIKSLSLPIMKSTNKAKLNNQLEMPRYWHWGVKSIWVWTKTFQGYRGISGIEMRRQLEGLLGQRTGILKGLSSQYSPPRLFQVLSTN